MANKLTTEIILNLAGNLSQKAKQYGNQIGALASTTNKSFAMISSSAIAASKGIDTWGNRTLLGVGAVSIAFERTFVKTAAQFERYQIMLNKLQGSEEAGTKAMAWIEQFTQDTPYGVNEVTNAFVRLKAFGLDPMDGTMQAIADQAAMMGGTAETVDGIALALGQAWTKGKLQGEEALQLLERGVPVWDYLVQASKDLGKNNGIGYTAAQLQDMASKGQLTREAISDLITYMGKASEGAARDQMNTWNGMISNMGDHWTIFQKDVMDSGAFNVLKKELGDFLAQLDEMKKSGEYDDFVQKVGQNLVDTFEAAADAIRVVKDVGEDLLPILRTVGTVTSSIADAVGGYDQLAKILLSIYMVNKALRISAPLLRSVGKAFGGKEGSGVAGSMATLGAMPVFVVNMPAGMGLEGATKKGPVAASTKSGKVINAAKTAAGVALPAYLAYEASSVSSSMIDSLLGESIPGYRELDAKFTTKMKAFFGDKEAQEQDVKYYGADPSKYTVKPMTPPSYMVGGYGGQGSYLGNSYMAGQTGGEMKLKVEVSDDRVKVTPTYLPKSFTIDPDMGAN